MYEKLFEQRPPMVQGTATVALKPGLNACQAQQAHFDSRVKARLETANGVLLQAKLTISACSWLAWTGLDDRVPGWRGYKVEGWQKAEGGSGEVRSDCTYSVREKKGSHQWTTVVFGKDDH
jgi:hypothetical protein